PPLFAAKCRQGGAMRGLKAQRARLRATSQEKNSLVLWMARQAHSRFLAWCAIHVGPRPLCAVFLKDGLLRAHLDGELGQADENKVADHLHECASCQRRLEILSQHANQVKQALQGPDSSPIDPALAYNRYRRRFGEPLEDSGESNHRWFATWKRPLLGGIS